jgi:alcohol dehydrogenase class IV
MVQIISGIGSFDNFEKLKNLYSGKNILLVTGKDSYSACGAKNILDNVLNHEKVLKFSDFDINPKIEDAKRGVLLAKKTNVNLIIAVGGGSVIDMAKLIKAFYVTPNLSDELAKGEIPVTDPNIPLIVAPTTAGSGSESTHFAVVYIGQDKYSLASKVLLPETVILDGKLIASGSSYQKACNGLDALSQAIESSWAVGSTEISRKFSFEAVTLCFRYINKDANETALQGMLDGANLAGQAINISKTTAAHAWSYGITSKYGLPHGHAVWLTLPAIFQIHANANKNNISDPRGIKHLNDIMLKLMNLLSIQKSDQAKEVLCELLASIKVENDMNNLGLEKMSDRSILSQNVNMQRMGNNPVNLNSNDISKIFELA